MYVVICRISSKSFFCGRSAGGGSASPSTPPTGRSNRPCTRVSASRRGQEERQKDAAVLSDRIIRLLRSVKVIRSGIPPAKGVSISSLLPLTSLCNCNVHYRNFPLITVSAIQRDSGRREPMGSCRVCRNSVRSGKMTADQE